MPKPTKSAIEEAMAVLAAADKQLIDDAIGVFAPLHEANDKAIADLEKLASTYAVPAGSSSVGINAINQHLNQLRAFQNTFNYIRDDLANRRLAFDPAE